MPGRTVGNIRHNMARIVGKRGGDNRVSYLPMREEDSPCITSRVSNHQGGTTGFPISSV